MFFEKINPLEIEKESMKIIENEMRHSFPFSPEEKLIVKRVIHATADFDYELNLKFSSNAVESGIHALLQNGVIITDTHMAESGISKPALKALGCEVHCYISDLDVTEEAKNKGYTRAIAAINKAACLSKDKPLIFAVGNAPTALIHLSELINDGKINPQLVIGAPVGFVNILSSKKTIMQCKVPYIVADGRKGGSNVVAAICNAMLYQVYDRSKGERC